MRYSLSVDFLASGIAGKRPFGSSSTDTKNNTGEKEKYRINPELRGKRKFEPIGKDNPTKIGSKRFTDSIGGKGVGYEDEDENDVIQLPSISSYSSPPSSSSSSSSFEPPSSTVENLVQSVDQNDSVFYGEMPLYILKHKLPDKWVDIVEVFEKEEYKCVRCREIYRLCDNVGRWKCFQHSREYDRKLRKWDCCGKLKIYDRGCNPSDHVDNHAGYEWNSHMRLPVELIKRFGVMSEAIVPKSMEKDLVYKLVQVRLEDSKSRVTRVPNQPGGLPDSLYSRIKGANPGEHDNEDDDADAESLGDIRNEEGERVGTGGENNVPLLGYQFRSVYRMKLLY
jgi:hypothetical protein